MSRSTGFMSGDHFHGVVQVLTGRSGGCELLYAGSGKFCISLSVIATED